MAPFRDGIEPACGWKRGEREFAAAVVLEQGLDYAFGMRTKSFLAVQFAVWMHVAVGAAAAGESRPFKDDADAKFWLENMVGFHRFTVAEVRGATGLAEGEISALMERLKIQTNVASPADRLLILPYPGGRHPRIGFLDGAIDPQRETKLSVFLPWDPSSYVVVDMPEAIWSNLGLTYLAHTHIPTVWSKEGIALPKQEWRRGPDGGYAMERTLPNGIRFGAEATLVKGGLRLREWLRNGTGEKLSDLRVQNCVMLKGAKGFNAQSKENKTLAAPYSAVRSADGSRWIITGWNPIHRAWENPPVPCIHADPKFPDCGPGQTVEVRGWLSFYEGNDIQGEFRRLDLLNWK